MLRLSPADYGYGRITAVRRTVGGMDSDVIVTFTRKGLPQLLSARPNSLHRRAAAPKRIRRPDP